MTILILQDIWVCLGCFFISFFNISMSVLPPDENLETKEPNGEKDEDENEKEQDQVKDLDPEKDDKDEDKSTEDNKDNNENKGPHMDLRKVYRRPPLPPPKTILIAKMMTALKMINLLPEIIQKRILNAQINGCFYAFLDSFSAFQLLHRTGEARHGCVQC